MWGDADLGAEVLRAGGAAQFLSRSVSLRNAVELLQACECQRAALQSAANALRDDASKITQTSRLKLKDARSQLDTAAARAAEVVSEYEARRTRLQAISDTFEEYRIARSQEEAVAKCRAVADAYVCVLETLGSHRQQGISTDMDTVAETIESLIQEVDAVRRVGPKSLFGESLVINKRILASFENRCVDSIIKARAAFVNVMDNEFRSFGWPMKVPQLGENQEMISHVNFYVRELKTLQEVAERYSFVAQRTRWHRPISDSWAMAAILRAPLARFKYHFLESYRASNAKEDGNLENLDIKVGSRNGMVSLGGQEPSSTESNAHLSTFRFDRPEWAAEFALARVAEAAPFLKEIVLDDSCTADLKFAEGFCKVFANKIACDCDFAIRASADDTDADLLIAQAADTARQFDEKLREGIVANNSIYHKNDSLPSSLDFLSGNDSFFATWASSEQRTSQTNVLNALSAMLNAGCPESALAEGEGGKCQVNLDVGQNMSTDVELECAEIADKISQASRGCRGLKSWSRIMMFVKWTELHLLESLRVQLQENLTRCEWQPKTPDEIFCASRAAWIAHALAGALHNKSCDPFYVTLFEQTRESPFDDVTAASCDDRDNGSVYDVEIEKLQTFSLRSCNAISDSVVDAFVHRVSSEYLSLVQFGELSATDAAVVLEHDLSDVLCIGMSELESSLSAVAAGVSNRKVSSSIWRNIAERLDNFFFERVILSSFTGGQRNGVSAVSSVNNYMHRVSAAKMSRQIAHDANVLVRLFSVVTPVPERFLGRSAEASHLLRIGSARVIRPKAAIRQRDEAVISAVVDCGKDEKCSNFTIIEPVGEATLSRREARECLIIAGMYDLLPLE